jgi:hypothetical protein
MSLLQDIKSHLDEILYDASDLEIANHSRHGAKWVAVSDMADPDIARNNCWVTSNEIYENIDFSEFAETDEVDIIGVEAPGCTHYAIYLANSEESIVLDFTARQFSPDAPFPFVLPVANWHAYMNHVTGREMVLSLGD